MSHVNYISIEKRGKNKKDVRKKERRYSPILSLSGVKPHLPPTCNEKVSQRKQIPVLVFEERTKWNLAGRQQGNGKPAGHRLRRDTLYTLQILSSKNCKLRFYNKKKRTVNLVINMRIVEKTLEGETKAR